MSEPQAAYDTDDPQPTPGPWTVKQGTVFSESGRGHIKHVASLMASHPAALGESEANGKLICAAGTAASELPDEFDAVAAVKALPELLAALGEIESSTRYADPWEAGGAHSTAKEALNKARGDSDE